MVVHDEDSEETVGVLDARVGHLNEDIRILLEVDHQLLLLLHVAESVFVYDVRVVEEQVVFAG